MHLRPKYLLLLAAPLVAIAGLKAQAVPAAGTSGRHETDVALNYTEQYSNLVSTPTFWHGGGSIELSTQLYHGLGLTANVTGTQTNNAADSSIGLLLVTATFGPRYTYYRPLGSERKHSLAIFGQALGGQAWGFDSYFPTSSGGQTDYISVAMQLGGGVDIALTRHLGIRAVQADWVRTQFPNGTTDVQNTLRLGAGVVFRFSPRR